MRGRPASEFPLVPNGARLITGLMLHDSKVAVGRVRMSPSTAHSVLRFPAPSFREGPRLKASPEEGAAHRVRWHPSRLMRERPRTVVASRAFHMQGNLRAGLSRSYLSKMVLPCM